MVHRDFLDADFLSIVKGIRGVQHDPVVDIEPLKDFESGAVVAADGNRSKVRSMIGIHHHRAESFRSE